MRLCSLFGRCGHLLHATCLGFALLIATAAPIKAQSANDGVDVVFEGEVEIFHVDYFDHRATRTDYFLRVEGASEPLQLRFENQPPRAVKPGAKVSIRGRAVGRQLWVQDVAATGETDDGSEGQSEPTVAGAADDHTVLAMLLNIDDGGTVTWQWDATDADNVSNVLYNNTYSVHSLYNEASHSQVGYPGGVTDVVIVTVPKSVGCSYYNYANNADAEAGNQGYNAASYRNRLYVLPGSAYSDCTWLALGQVGSYGNTSSSYRSWTTTINAPAIVHEFGHNHGWHHAATDTDNNGSYEVEYGDRSDVMGYCCYQRKFNSVHLDQIGWLDNWPDQTVTVASGGSYTVARLGTDPNTNPLPQILKVDKPGTSESYYISLKQAVDLDSGIPSSYQGLAVHHGDENGIWSYWIQPLGSDGAFFSDAASGITVTRLSVLGEQATVDIAFGSCVPASPSVTVSETSSDPYGTGEASYDVGVQDNHSGDCEGSTNYALSVAEGGASATLGASAISLAPGAGGATSMTASATSDGSYTLTVTASGGGVSGSDSVTLHVDKDGPEFATGDAISFGSKKNKGQSYVKLSWPTASNPGGSVSLYEIWRNGVLVATTTATSYNDLAAPTTTTYDYEVAALDPQSRKAMLAGNSSSGGDGGGGGNGGNKGGGNGKGKPK